MAGPIGMHKHMGLPFDVQEDPYTRQVRISAHGFTQAVPLEVWYSALAERGMMDDLVRNFLENLKRWESSRINSTVDMLMNPYTMETRLVAPKGKPLIAPQSKPVTASSKPNLLLLCED